VFVGSDENVRQKKASWRASRNDGMIGAWVVHNDAAIKIQGMGEYWQSDTYESNVGQNIKPQRVARRISKKITAADRWFRYLTHMGPQVTIAFNDLDHTGGMVEVPKEHVGKWMVLEYDIPSDSIRHYISNHRV
jgi:hypothetical protein